MSISPGRDARLVAAGQVSSCEPATTLYRYWRVGATTVVAAGTRRSSMTSSPPRSHAQHMAFLAGATAVNAVHTLAEITRASGNLLAGAGARAAHPVGLATHGAR